MMSSELNMLQVGGKRRRRQISSFVTFVVPIGTMLYLALDSLAGFDLQYEYGAGRRLAGPARYLAHNPEEHRDRLLAITKTKWPECVENELTSQECKDLIDNDIQTLFTEQDRNISTYVLKRRAADAPNYNLVVIRTESTTGRVRGVWKDGMVYYDWQWNSTGVEATEAQQTDIPPVNGMNMPGVTIDDYMSGNATQYLAGGTYPIYEPNSEAGQERLDAYLATPKTIAPAGLRNVGPWDCSGLNGVSCCAMIKHSVRDADARDNAIQCWIEPHLGVPGTRATCEADLTKLCIYENHDGKVSKVPILMYGKVARAAGIAEYS